MIKINHRLADSQHITPNHIRYHFFLSFNFSLKKEISQTSWIRTASIPIPDASYSTSKVLPNRIKPILELNKYSPWLVETISFLFNSLELRTLHRIHQRSKKCTEVMNKSPLEYCQIMKIIKLFDSRSCRLIANSLNLILIHQYAICMHYIAQELQLVCHGVTFHQISIYLFFSQNLQIFSKLQLDHLVRTTWEF